MIYFLIPKQDGETINAGLEPVYKMLLSSGVDYFTMNVNDLDAYKKARGFDAVMAKVTRLKIDEYFNGLNKMEVEEGFTYIDSQGSPTNDPKSALLSGGYSVSPSTKVTLIPPEGDRILHPLEADLIAGETPQEVAKKYKKKEAIECAKALNVSHTGTEVAILTRIQKHLLDAN